ncbi:MAG: hypothetical protein IJQ37_03290 [Clostridia bacterium]|nr:hypothetical protein [Clostridia bacterium]
MFETRVKIEEKLFKDIYFSIMTLWVKILNIALAVVEGAMAVLMIVSAVGFYKKNGTHYIPYYIFAIVFLALAVFLVVNFFVIQPRRYGKLYAERLAESSGTGEMYYVTSFGDEGVVTVNSATDNKTVLRYEVLTRLAKSKDYILVGTKTRQYAIINAAQLSSSDVDAMMKILKEKSNIKNLK